MRTLQWGGYAFLAWGERGRAEGLWREMAELLERTRYPSLTRLAIAELLLEPDALTPTLSQGERGQRTALSQGEGEQRRAEARPHLDFAIEEFRAMKMQPSLERALRHKGLLTA
jgi:hypothetical protein